MKIWPVQDAKAKFSVAPSVPSVYFNAAEKPDDASAFDSHKVNPGGKEFKSLTESVTPKNSKAPPATVPAGSVIVTDAPLISFVVDVGSPIPDAEA